MIKSVSLTNFQSHEDTDLHFHKGVNVIVGQSDSGKTAIIRALKWIVFNRPSGEEFRSNWGGKTTVEVFTEDAHIVRIKGKENEYILGDTHFKAFGTDVPQEIIQAFNMGDINLQQQLDNIFLLSLSPGQVAEFFNKVARLDKIDQATSSINSAIRGLEQDVKYKEAELDQQEAQLHTFDYLDKMEAEIEVLEELDKQYNILLQRSYTLLNLHDRIEQVKEFIEQNKPLLALEKDVIRIEELQGEKDEIRESQVDLAELIADISATKIRLKKHQRILNLEKQVTDIIALTDKRDELNMKVGDFGSDIWNIWELRKRMTSNEEYLTRLKEKFDKEMGDVCVLCGSKLKHKHNDEINRH